MSPLLYPHVAVGHSDNVPVLLTICPDLVKSNTKFRTKYFWTSNTQIRAISSVMASTISAKHLTFSYNSFSPPCLVDFNLNLTPGSRTILVGANGGLELAHFNLKSILICTNSWEIDLVTTTCRKETHHGWSRTKSERLRCLSRLSFRRYFLGH